MAQGHCPRCDRRWTGQSEAHCPTCHLQFGSTSAFDRHRTGRDEARHCMTEDEMALPREKSGKPTLVPILRHGAIYWVSEARNRDAEALRGE